MNVVSGKRRGRALNHTNAGGGRGLVLATVACDAGIINAAFYTTLVITAVLPSQMTTPPE